MMMRVLEAFAGLGGLALSWHRMGAEHVGFVERDPFCRRILARHWPSASQHEDVLLLDGRAFRGRVDVLSGGPPCQPISTAGKHRGTADDRWLWGRFVSLAVECEAPVVFAENPLGLLSTQGGDAFFAVLSAFGAAGYSIEWDILAAGTVGAPHRRERVWIVARRDGAQTWSQDEQPALFPGRPAAWSRAGRWTGGRLIARAPRWPTPSPLPWETAADADALPTPCSGLHNDGEDPRAWEARRRELAARHGNNGAGTPLAVAARRSALPTSTREMDGGSRSGPDSRAHPGLSLSDVALGTGGGLRRSALPTPTAEDSERSSDGGGRGGGPSLVGIIRSSLPTPQAREDRGTPGTASRAAGGFQCSLPARIALPIPTARDFRCAGADRSDNPHAQPLPQVLADRGLRDGRLNPTLPEWMMGLPLGWSLPDGESLAGEPSAPWLPDRTAELALTTERQYRRPRLRALGNAVCPPQAEAVLRSAALGRAVLDAEARP